MCRIHHVKCQAGWITRWTQDCQEKYQQPLICRCYHSYGIRWRGTKDPLDDGETQEWKNWLETHMKQTKIIANGRGKSGSSDRFFFLCSQITSDGDCSHEIKRRLLLERKAMTNLDIVLKSRNITLLTKVRIVKAMFFPIVMYGCESWIINKAEHRIIDAFELCWYRRLLRIPWQQGDQASQS